MLFFYRDPEIKRRMCQRCSLLLEPGNTCRIRFHRDKKSGALFQVVTCLACGFLLRLRMDAKHEILTSTLPVVHDNVTNKTVPI